MNPSMPMLHELALHTLHPSPTNPRKTFADLEDLAASIREQGVMQPILARLWPDDYPTPDDCTDRPLYEIIAGERRYRASVLAGLDTIPALVRHVTTRQVLEQQIVENLQRRDVSELEEAEGYDLMMRQHGYTADELADKVGKSRAYIYGRLKLCALCEEARKAFREGKLSASHALLVARIPGKALQQEAVARIGGDEYHGPMAYRAAADYVQRTFMLDLTKAPFETEDPLLLMRAPPCGKCPKRAGNSPELFPDVNPDVCTDPGCYAEKKARNLSNEIELARVMERKLITGPAAAKLAPHGMHSAKVGDYVQLDVKEYYGNEHRTARAAIGDQSIDIVLIEDARSGRLVEAVSSKTLTEALRAAGVKVSKSTTRSPREIAHEHACKLEKQVRMALFEAHHAAARSTLNTASKPHIGREDLALIARQFWASRGSDACKRLARMYVPDAPEREDGDSQYQDEDYRRTRRMNAMIDEFNHAQLILFLLDLALISTLDVATYSTDISTPDPLLDSVRRAGLDADAIRVSIEDPKAAKTAPTPTTAPRGGEVTAPSETPVPTKAARAASVKPVKGNGQAAGAAKKATGKALKSGRAAAERMDKTTACPSTESPAIRCDRTMDLLEASFPELKASAVTAGRGVAA
ncbi:MAG: ParB/RepB/Spo0J family partition protein [Azoarcus sp.]|nr:ParB/RepB/Spo0J family partition protein [Azoarcus sp.]